MAYVLCDYSAKIKPKETVLLSGSIQAEPLLSALYKRVLEHGAYPLVRMTIPEAEHMFYTHANDDQLKHVSDIALYEAKHIDAAIYVQSESNTKCLSEIDPAKIALTRQMRKHISDIIMKRVRWTLTLFPTSAYAQDAGMSRIDFEQFVMKALFADKPDPVGEWRALSKRQDRIIKGLAKAREVRILAKDTDLVLSVAGRKFINSNGHRNMPCGEVFTGPVETSANGYIHFTYPVCLSGNEIKDVFLRFKNGKVIEARAGSNENFLKKMIDIDPGAKRIGELGIGTNYGIDRFIKNILFDEKIGGSIHLALGKSYTETGGKNKSALHWDMIKDLRDGGEFHVDGRVFQKNGKFV